MFKVGDKVKCVKSISPGEGGPKTGEIFTVTAVEGPFIGFVLSRLDDSYSAFIKRGVSTNWHSLSFELVKDDPIPHDTGVKLDSNKPDLSLIPTDAIWGTAAALSYGANKYARHNFRKGIAYSRLVAAAMRHLTAWNEGEELDSESGLSHLDHAMATLAMLKFMSVNKTEMDDRFKVEKKSLTQKALDTFPENNGKNR
jgi:Domain of unknown function (DUF5664)